MKENQKNTQSDEQNKKPEYARVTDTRNKEGINGDKSSLKLLICETEIGSYELVNVKNINLEKNDYIQIIDKKIPLKCDNNITLYYYDAVIPVTPIIPDDNLLNSFADNNKVDSGKIISNGNRCEVNGYESINQCSFGEGTKVYYQVLSKNKIKIIGKVG